MLIKQRLFFAKRIYKYINITIDILEDLNILRIKGPLGFVNFGFSNKELKYINNKGDFIMQSKKKQIFLKNLREGVRGVLVPWIRSFEITGYQYKIAYSYVKHKLGLHLGFTYWVIINLTTNNMIYLKPIKGKYIRSISRKFILTSVNYEHFKDLKKYLNIVRNLLPYKLKGLTFPSIEKKIKLKVGKKVKYR